MVLSVIWETISRTRSIPVGPPHTFRRYTRPPPESIWKSFHESLEVTLPLAFYYVIAVVIDGIGRERTTICLVLASLISIFNGFCFGELVTSSRYCSSSLITVTYQLGGEICAYFVSLNKFLSWIATSALLAKCLSGTLEAIGHSHIRTISLEQFGLLPFSGEPPDLLAIGVASVTTVLLAFGLQSSGLLKLVMNGLSLLMVMFISIVVCVHYFSNDFEGVSNSNKFAEPNQVPKCVAILTCLFQQYSTLGNRSKLNPKPKKFLIRSIPVSAGGIMVMCIIFTIVSPKIFDIRDQVFPLIEGKYALRDWESFTICCFLIVILGIGLSESGESAANQIIASTAEGFLPKWLAYESPRYFVHSRAHCLTGLFIIVCSGTLTSYSLLVGISTFQLCISICLTLVRIHMPYRKVKTPNHVASTNNDFKWSLLTIWNFIKSKIISSAITGRDRERTTTKPKKRKTFRQSSFDDDIETPLLTGLYSSVEEFNSENENGILCKEPFPLVSIRRFSGENREPPNLSDLETPDEEVDVDTIILEFKECQANESSNTFLPNSFSTNSFRSSLILLALLFCSNCLFSFFLQYKLQETSKTVAVCIVFVIFETVCVFLVNCLSKNEKTSLISLRLPAFPWLHSILLFMNVFLLVSLLNSIWWLIGPVFILGFILYASYSRKYSYCAQKEEEVIPEEVPVLEPQIVWLPSITAPCLIEMQTFPQPSRNLLI